MEVALLNVAQVNIKMVIHARIAIRAITAIILQDAMHVQNAQCQQTVFLVTQQPENAMDAKAGTHYQGLPV